MPFQAIVEAQIQLPARDVLAAPGALPPMAYVPYRRNRDFVGRQKTLRYLAECLLPWPDADSEQPRTVAVTGMGGQGKTQVAVEFAYRYGRYYPGGVYWMSFAQADNVPKEIASIGSQRGMGLYKDTDKLTLMGSGWSCAAGLAGACFTVVNF